MVVVVVTVGRGAVLVTAVMPQQEQAEEYSAESSQEEA